MPYYRDDRRILWYKRSSSAPLWTGAMLACAFAVMFLVMFGPVQTGQQTASNANAPAAQVPALYTTVSDPSK